MEDLKFKVGDYVEIIVDSKNGIGRGNCGDIKEIDNKDNGKQLCEVTSDYGSSFGWFWGHELNLLKRPIPEYALSPRKFNELDAVDDEVREIFSDRTYTPGTPLLVQILKELRKIKKALKLEGEING